MNVLISGLSQKLSNLIRWGRVTNVGNDDKQFPQSQFEYMGKVKDVVTLYPYGMSAKAPLDTIAVVMTVGHEENSIAVEMSENIRPKGLVEDEAVFGNFVIGSIIKFRKNGDIEITCKKDQIIDIVGDSTVNIGGNSLVNVTGTTTVNSTGELTVTAPTAILNAITTINGNTTINGTLTVSQTIAATGSISTLASVSAVAGIGGASVSASGGVSGATVTAGSIDLGSHTHGGVTPGGGSTGGPQ